MPASLVVIPPPHARKASIAASPEEVCRRLQQAVWRQTPLVQALVELLGVPAMRFVGGIVRDTLAGLPSQDVDIATWHRPHEVVRRLQAGGLRVLPTGISHGTVTALMDSERIEITTLRADIATNGRHAEVAFTRDWQQDAARRDLSINALYASPDGTLFDPFSGLMDLRAGRVRFIGDPAARIAEDRLRMLRFFRFWAAFGTGPPDMAALAAISAARGAVADLSAERLAGELKKILAGPAPVRALTAMCEAGISLDGLLIPATLAALAALQAAEVELALAPDPALRLAALVAASDKPAQHWQTRLRLAGSETRALAAAAALAAEPMPVSVQGWRRALYRYGPFAARSRARTSAPASEQLALEALFAAWQRPVMPLDGADLIAAGLPQGRALGDALARAEAAWIEADFQPGKAALLAALGLPAGSDGAPGTPARPHKKE